MGIWGPGLMQTDDDYEIAIDLSAACGCQLVFEKRDEHKKGDTIKILNDGVLSKQLDKILSGDFRPHTSYHKRERVAVVLTMLAMELGAKIETRQLTTIQVLRPLLPTMEQQLQLFTALDEYKNDGTPWITGSKNFKETRGAAPSGKMNSGLGDPFRYSGLGHSADDFPTAEMASKACLSCGEKEHNLLRCSRCKMARYCDKKCQRYDWGVHQRVCKVHESPRVCATEESSTPVINPVGRDYIPLSID
ncbi:hypothetical protein F4781DRAFT_432058 [Annulohypoxylon bovei var. microspora]|nr:hypothetical protein F4781DRAFT_432058 [Annulohypoxylon bovei var. microspora]